MSWNRIRIGHFKPRLFASSITSVRSTEAPASCNGLATTWPASLMSKYFAPQRWMLYRLRDAWTFQAPLASVGLLIFASTEAHYRRMRGEFNTWNEDFPEAGSRSV